MDADRLKQLNHMQYYTTQGGIEAAEEAVSERTTRLFWAWVATVAASLICVALGFNTLAVVVAILGAAGIGITAVHLVLVSIGHARALLHNIHRSNFSMLTVAMGEAEHSGE